MDIAENRNQCITYFHWHIAYSNRTTTCTRIARLFSFSSGFIHYVQETAHLYAILLNTPFKRLTSVISQFKICRPISRAILMGRVHFVTPFLCRILVTMEKTSADVKTKENKTTIKFLSITLWCSLCYQVVT